jgi:hypothetical protein
MSLQLAAQHLASRGRGPDTTLVHMAPGEVDSLQAIAKAHGGSLTINPDTGLPEAGFLSSILPMVAGLALGPAGFGLTAMQAGLAAGALGTVATGSLRKGIMAGLGAYGGAGIGGVIGNAGANAIGNAAATATPAATAVPTLPPMGVANAVPAFPSSATPADLYADLAEIGTSASSPVTPQTVLQGTPLPGAYTVDPSAGFPRAITPTPVPASGATTVAPFGGFGGAANISPAQAAQALPVQAAPAPAPAPTTPPAFPSGAIPADQYADLAQVDAREKAIAKAGKFGQFKAGLSAIMDKPDLLLNKKNMMYGAAALAPLMLQSSKQPTYQGSGPNPYQYTYNPGRTGAGPSRDSSESTYFRPFYTRLAEGGSTSPTRATSPSLDYYRYLMGSANTPMSSALPDTIAAPASNGIGAAMPTSSDPYFSYLMGEGSAPAPTFTVNPVDMSYTPPAKAADLTVGTGARTYYDQGGPGADTPSGLAGPSQADIDDQDAGAGMVASAPGISVDEFARGGLSSIAFARGGYNLGDYSDGGRLLRGPGDGVSDSIPASIGRKRPARLADGEFVVPARIVSELGNGSTEAGARKLYAMMDRVQKNRRKSIGKGKVAVNSRSDRLLPA